MFFNADVTKKEETNILEKGLTTSERVLVHVPPSDLLSLLISGTSSSRGSGGGYHMFMFLITSIIVDWRLGPLMRAGFGGLSTGESGGQWGLSDEQSLGPLNTRELMGLTTYKLFIRFVTNNIVDWGVGPLM